MVDRSLSRIAGAILVLVTLLLTSCAVTPSEPAALKPMSYSALLSISEMGHFLNRTLWHNQVALASSLRPRL